MHTSALVGFVFLCACSLFAQGESDKVPYLKGVGALPNPTYSGYIEVNPQYGVNLYYYFAESQSSSPLSDPLVLWFNGGPGCSSLFGTFVENGPQLITANGTLYNNPYSWNARANVMWIDQPAGTGYSYVKSPQGYVHDEKTLAEELYILLTTFLTQHPEYSKLPLYIFGESYAGKYIPSFSTEIMNQNANNPKIFLNLQGIGLGDGWVDPYIQTGSYGPFLYSFGMITQAELAASTAMYYSYQGLMDAGSYEAADIVGNALLESLTVAAGNVDVYDIRYQSDDDPTDPLNAALETYLNEPEVRLQLNVGVHKWTSCATAPYISLMDDVEQSVANLLPALLANYQVMNYNGNYDLICNVLGTTQWSNAIVWPGQDAYVRAQNNTWIVDGSVAGSWKYGGNLTHLIVNDAGHMAPFNQPLNTQNMLYTFIQGGFETD